jgi:hypothetical protein
MNVVLLRVGIDMGCGGMHSPLFKDGGFEFLPIPDDDGWDERTYGNTKCRRGRKLVDYFPARRQSAAAAQAMHVDPEFSTFTYGDPTTPKRGLSRLTPGDLLVFYAGMEGWDCEKLPALYLAGFFEVKIVAFAAQLPQETVRREFAGNFHVRHRQLYTSQKDRLVLVKGTRESRLFRNARKLGGAVRRANGSVWQIISPEMAKIFGHFGGIGSIQRSTPRWVEKKSVPGAAAFVRSLS